jgi:2-keto-4-pentenoate hydratase/2-oxohepta-3-ene-1,7-dioic acid hydratase in catechol pathway
LRLVTFRKGHDIGLGAWKNESVIDITAVAPDMLSLIAMGADGIALAEEVQASAVVSYPVEDVALLAPIPVPNRNIMCLGLNYAEHAMESYAATGQKAELPEVPVVLTKATTAVIGPYDPIPFNPQVSAAIDWEVELAFIIGREGINIPASDAMDYVFGFTVINDVSARDLQRQGKQFFKGKSLDGSCPMGPWILTLDEAPDTRSLRITSRVNGVTKQDSNTTHMIFDLPATIAHLSKGMTLLPGDIIATGTPSGVGFARQPPEFLQPGDIVECEVEGIGLIRNEVAAASK